MSGHPWGTARPAPTPGLPPARRLTPTAFGSLVDSVEACRELARVARAAAREGVAALMRGTAKTPRKVILEAVDADVRADRLEALCLALEAELEAQQADPVVSEQLAAHREERSCPPT